MTATIRTVVAVELVKDVVCGIRWGFEGGDNTSRIFEEEGLAINWAWEDEPAVSGE